MGQKIQPTSGRKTNVSKPDGSMAELLKQEMSGSAGTGADSVQAAAEARPSQFETSHRQRLRNRKNFSLGQLPVFVIDEFDRLAAEQGLKSRAYFYHILRQMGADIPPDSMMDARKL